MSSIKPIGITANRNLRQLHVSWESGHESVYPFSLLRYACPCAECRGGHENMRSEPDEEVFDRPDEQTQATMVQNVEAVGAYGITIHWEDGHHFGIYNWRYLRALCPCESCRIQPD